MRTEKYSRSIDELDADLIVVTLYEDERPPRGIGGFIDWRLRGFVSRAILSGAIKGAKDESILIPLQQRVPGRRLLLLGLGSRAGFNLASARHTAYKLGKQIVSLGARNVALTFPAAFDERLTGETERSVVSAMEQAEIPRDVFIRWLDPSVITH